MLALAAVTARAQFNNDNLSARVYYNNDFGMWVVDVEMNNENIIYQFVGYNEIEH